MNLKRKEQKLEEKRQQKIQRQLYLKRNDKWFEKKTKKREAEESQLIEEIKQYFFQIPGVTKITPSSLFYKNYQIPLRIDPLEKSVRLGNELLIYDSLQELIEQTSNYLSNYKN